MFTPKTNTDAPIVLIYLNNKITKYIQENLKLLSKTFPDRRIILVSDRRENQQKIPKRGNVKFYLLENFEKQYSKVSDHSSLPRNFRNGFWISTIARFKALEIFMVQAGESRAFHIEADVLLLWNFPFDCEMFKDAKLAYPYVSSQIAAASVFFVGEISTLVDLNTFIEKSVVEEPGITDMKILANYGSLKQDNVVQLFSGFGDFDKPCKKHLFDAATLGMYFTGQDPRNAKGFVRTYFDVDDHLVKPSKLRFDYNEKNEAVVHLGDRDYILTNLHIHSKQRKYFSQTRSEKLVRRSIVERNKNEKNTFSFEIWIRMVMRYLASRIRIGTT